MSKKSQFHGAGYMLVDNSASDWGNKIESDVLTCVKCQALLHRHDYVDQNGAPHVGWAHEGAYCHKCDGPMCHACGSGPPCAPDCGGFMKEFAEMVEEAYRLEQNAKVLGI